MGKASSAKKVQRAAKVGGTAKVGRERKFGFPLAIAAIVLLGFGLIFFVRAEQVGEAAIEPRLGRDHWHNAFAVYTCDAFEPPFVDTEGDRYGIHTHEDGLIHIHPTSGNASGENAKLSRFTDEIGIEFGDDSFTLPNGDEYTTGEDCNGEPGEVRLLKWKAGEYETEPQFITTDFAATRFDGDGDAFALVFATEAAFEDPSQFLPPSLAGINDVSDLGPGEEPLNVSIPENLVTTPGLPPDLSIPDDLSTLTVPATEPAGEPSDATTATTGAPAGG